MPIIKKILLALLAVFCIVLLGALTAVFGYFPKYLFSGKAYDISQKEDTSEITVLSANVRCFSPTDTFKKSWFYRAGLVVENVRSCEPDIIGFQEVTRMHYSYLTGKLKGYDSVIRYRDDAPWSEACPVFYNTSRFELVDKGSFWLSETPEVKSRDWGAACYRICSYVILSQKEDGKKLVVFNTHLDHISDTARINGIKVVLDKIEQFGGIPSIIMGDLNAVESSSTYAAVTENFYDAKYRTDNTDSGATYQNFGASLSGDNIDYFMISKEGITVEEYKVVRTVYDGVYPSDHFPIEMKINID